MQRMFLAGLIVVLAGGVVVALAKPWHASAEPENHELTPLTGKMRTICVGRFLIDMPHEAVVDMGRASVNGFDIAAFDEATDEFHARLAQREQEIKAKPDRLGGGKNLESVKEVSTDSGLIGKIFVHSRAVHEGTAGNGLVNERYRYEGIAVEALVHGAGVSIDLGSDFYFPEKIDDLNKLVRQLMPNPHNQIPGESGFCIDRAYIRDLHRADQREQITMFADLPSRPDIDFSLILAAGVKPDGDGLLKRGAAAEDGLPLTERWRLTRMRAEHRQIGGLRGEELVRRVIEANDAVVYSLNWEVNGSGFDVFTPHMTFSMITGKSNDGPVPTSMSEDAVLGLWDKILSSIRVRPTVKQERESANPMAVRTRKHAIGNPLAAPASDSLLWRAV